MFFRKMQESLAAGAVAVAMLAAAPAFGAGTESVSDQQQLVTEAQFTAQNFVGAPDLAWVHQNMGRAKAIMIVPQLVKGGFVVGGSGGSGVLLVHEQGNVWSYPAFFTMGSASVGFQIGGEVSEIVLMVMTDRGMNGLKNTNFKLGGDINIAAGPVGAGAAADTADIVAFSRSKGLYGGLNVEGAFISPRNDWNTSYYGKSVTSAEIIEGADVQNAGAEPLRDTVAKLVSSKTSASNY